MKIKYVSLGIVLGLFLSSAMVVAKTCYVDKDSSSGNGSKDNPYETINKALDKNCDKLKVKKGKYKESIILGKEVSLEGDNQKTILFGHVKMKEGSSLKDVYVDGEGVEVLEGANTTVDNVKIENSHIGIKTIGSGKLTVRNCTITHNDGKGLYLQYGKKIDLRDSVISHNAEEGVDIRANVDGVIMNNKIDSNKEGGIEVIAGKSQLIIKNNSLQHNKSSGIAVQFYKSTKNLGRLTIAGNQLVGNGNYGIDCKIPSGGNPQAGYWSKSIGFEYNKISGNGKGSLAKFCKFGDEQVKQATLTAEEIQKMEDEKKADAIKKAENEKKEKEKLEEQLKLEAEKKEREEKKRNDLWKKDEIVRNFAEKEKQCFLSHNDLEILEKKSKWYLFFVGPDEEMIQRYAEREKKCAGVIAEIENKMGEIETDEVKQDLENNYLQKLRKQNEIIKNDGEAYRKKFGLWKWVMSFWH